MNMKYELLKKILYLDICSNIQGSILKSTCEAQDFIKEVNRWRQTFQDIRTKILVELAGVGSGPPLSQAHHKLATQTQDSLGVSLSQNSTGWFTQFLGHSSSQDHSSCSSTWLARITWILKQLTSHTCLDSLTIQWIKTQLTRIPNKMEM